MNPKTNVKRYKKAVSLPVLKDGSVTNITKENIFRMLGADNIISFPREDFVHLKNVRENLTHFNLQCTNHKPGKKYALILIIKQGFFDGNKQVLPVVSLDNARVAECIGVRNNVAYDELKQKDFEHSLEHIKSVPELKKAIVRRYSRSMAHLSKEQILSLGVGITHLRMLDT